MKFRSDVDVQLVNSMGGDDAIVQAARVSTKGQNAASDHGETKGLINYLIKHRHGTPFEHSAMTFFVRAPIFVWREWHRHRVGFSYNEESARYKQLEPEFWVPAADRKMVPVKDFKPARPKFEPADDVVWLGACNLIKAQYEAAYILYLDLMAAHVAREVARCVLPVGIYSSCWVTCNARSLMHFLSLRTHRQDATFVSYPQHEIEIAAEACETLFASGWPITHAAFCENGRVAP